MHSPIKVIIGDQNILTQEQNFLKVFRKQFSSFLIHHLASHRKESFTISGGWWRSQELSSKSAESKRNFAFLSLLFKDFPPGKAAIFQLSIEKSLQDVLFSVFYCSPLCSPLCLTARNAASSPSQAGETSTSSMEFCLEAGPAATSAFNKCSSFFSA